jgi:CHAT domain-containing protein
LANASAAVVSLWSVDDGSTAALMRFKYAHLAEGRTVPQALRLVMLRLARGRAADGLPEEWKRPFYWAGFVVVGATTRLPLL